MVYVSSVRFRLTAVSGVRPSSNGASCPGTVNRMYPVFTRTCFTLASPHYLVKIKIISASSFLREHASLLSFFSL